MKLRYGVFLILFSLFITGNFSAQEIPPVPPHPPRTQKAPPPKDSENTFKYRGSRIYNENLPLKILQAKCSRIEDGNVFLEIIFNQSINPWSVKPYNLLVNNKPMSPGVRFAFSKKGDRIKVIMPMKENSFKLKVLNIRSFGDVEIEPLEFLVEVRGFL